MKNDQRERLKELQLAGLTNAQGRLQAYFDGDAAVWVPPTTDFVEGSVSVNSIKGLQAATEFHPGSQEPEGNREIYIRYPVPEEWEMPVENGRFWLSRNKPIRVGLQEKGWKIRKNVKGSYLLEDFIELCDGSPEKIQRFVLQWGPLWMCFKHGECYFGSPAANGQVDNFCQWYSTEPTTMFKVRAQQIRAAFNIAAHLLDQKPTLENDWNELGWHIKMHAEALVALGMGSPSEIKELSPENQRFLLTHSINNYLTPPMGPHFWINWRDTLRARLSVQYGLGFFRLAWLQIAQLITQATGYSICDNCAQFFVWHEIKPPRGKNNFCERCREKGRKRLWAQESRAKAKSLSSEGSV